MADRGSLARLGRRAGVMTRVATSTARALPTSVAYRAEFDQVERYVVFVGHRRSGHSLVGSLLNAHPEVVISHQLNALLYVAARVPRNQLYALILQADRAFEERGRVSDTGAYDYLVPGQWQGRYRRLRVIGDKRGGSSTSFLRERPELLDRLRALTGVPITLINIHRNPFDQISTYARRSEVTLAAAADNYFRATRSFAALRALAEPAEWLEARHEELLVDPHRVLGDLCRGLGVDPGPEYLEACAGILYRAPHRSRFEMPWDDALVAQVSEQMAEFPFLAGYRYEEPS